MCIFAMTLYPFKSVAHAYYGTRRDWIHILRMIGSYRAAQYFKNDILFRAGIQYATWCITRIKKQYYVIWTSGVDFAIRNPKT